MSFVFLLLAYHVSWFATVIFYVTWISIMSHVSYVAVAVLYASSDSTRLLKRSQWCARQRLGDGSGTQQRRGEDLAQKAQGLSQVALIVLALQQPGGLVLPHAKRLPLRHRSSITAW